MGTIQVTSQVEDLKERSLLPMIAKMSRDTYNKLPHSERLGISVEDFIAEGKLVVLTKAAKTYKPLMHVKFSTYAFKVLDNHFKSILRDAYAEKRCAVLLSLDFEYKLHNGKVQTLYDRMARSKKHVIENSIIARIDAERAFIKAYAIASPQLRKYLIKWLLQPNATSRAKEGINSSLAMREFSEMSVRFLTEEMCQTIQKDYMCRTNIANLIVSKFFTPKNSICTSNPNFTLRKTVEFSILPILSVERQAAIMALV